MMRGRAPNLSIIGPRPGEPGRVAAWPRPRSDQANTSKEAKFILSLSHHPCSSSSWVLLCTGSPILTHIRARRCKPIPLLSPGLVDRQCSTSRNECQLLECRSAEPLSEGHISEILMRIGIPGVLVSWFLNSGHSPSAYSLHFLIDI